MSKAAVKESNTDLVGQIETLARNLGRVRTEVGKVIFGQEKIVDETLISLLCGGHALLIGVPGLAKTKLVDTLGTVLGMDAKRIQCTPDLMPSDILGSEVLEEDEHGKRDFRFIPGPVFCQLLMADEINRASPRTQSALLQAMQEHQVSVAGVSRDVPTPFHVLATQNPLEQEGTYPLPEAQLDRFLLQIDVDYPTMEAERKVITITTGLDEGKPKKIMSAKDLIAAQRVVRQVPVGQDVVDAILELVRRARPETSTDPDITRQIIWGPGPRAGQALMLAARARAVMDGRLSPSLDDVVALAKPVLQHRMALSFAAKAEGVTIDSIIEKICAPIS